MGLVVARMQLRWPMGRGQNLVDTDCMGDQLVRPSPVYAIWHADFETKPEITQTNAAFE